MMWQMDGELGRLSIGIHEYYTLAVSGPGVAKMGILGHHVVLWGAETAPVLAMHSAMNYPQLTMRCGSDFSTCAKKSWCTIALPLALK